MVPPVTAPDPAATRIVASGPGLPLVEAKLLALAPAPGTVARPRLLARVLDPDAPPILSLIAGPGYGKTTLLAQVVAAESRPVAWLTLDDLDNDPAILVGYLEAAFARVHDGADGSNGHAVGAEGVLAVRRGVPRLIERLHRSRRPAVLVLDDAHRITDPMSIDVLVAILDHLPAGFRVAIAGRHEPALPLARWRAGRQLLDIGEDELALDETETAALLAAAGCTVPADEARALTAQTEGWAAATYLAALALVRNPRSTPAVTGATGRDGFIAAYLRSEVRAGFDAEDLELLARTSVLDSVTPDAAVALTGIEAAPLRLRSIARRNLLVHEVASGPISFRYHNLLRAYLLEELERDEPGATRALHARAAAWYASSGRHELAVEHAMLAGDDVAAARLATAGVIPTLYAGRGATVDRWAASFDDATYRAYPPLAVVAAWTHIVNGRAESADRLADLVDGSRFDGVPADGTATFPSQRAMLRALMCRRGPAEALSEADDAAAIEAGGHWRSTSLWLVGSLRWLNGDVAGGEAALQAASSGPDATAAGAIALAKRAAIRLAAGDWRGAEALHEESEAMLRGARWEALLAAFFVHAIAARIAIARGDVPRGRAELVRAQVVRPTASHAAPWLSVDALLELARAYLAISDPAGAQTALREAEAIIRHRPALGTLVGELVELRHRIGGAADALAGSSTLTTAELRVLPLLPTYLSFQDIADRLGISRNTVKTHAMSIYGKLWASSRGEAVERAVELGLLEPYPGLDGLRGVRADAVEGEEAG